MDCRRREGSLPAYGKLGQQPIGLRLELGDAIRLVGYTTSSR